MNTIAKKGGIWKFTLQVHLPVSQSMRHSALFSCLKDQMACQVWRVLSAGLSRDATKQFAATAFGYRVSFRQKLE
jgi:hypothetical protein